MGSPMSRRKPDYARIWVGDITSNENTLDRTRESVSTLRGTRERQREREREKENMVLYVWLALCYLLTENIHPLFPEMMSLDNSRAVTTFRVIIISKYHPEWKRGDTQQASIHTKHTAPSSAAHLQRTRGRQAVSTSLACLIYLPGRPSGEAESLGPAEPATQRAST
ncbi:hypothetical protein F4778DRAFT_334155 [Xylariomycetidae sp. FL2044]|nr:hypothetical protein F4778DRAFT_334155 [Xylariomycetidae sp. FL2044]